MNKAELLEVYRQMRLCRAFETKVAEMYTKGKIGGFCHLYVGQEAVAVGALWHLRRDDYVVGSYRDHAYFLVRGGDPGACMAELYGHSNGCCKGRGGSMHLYDARIGFLGGYAIVAGGVPIAVGLGMAIQYRQTDQVVMCFFGDGATNQGVYHEAMNMAGLYRLPIVFVCENNLYAIGTSVARSSAQALIRKKAEAYDIPGVQVDGMDFFKMESVAKRAIQQARRGKGPTFIEARCYRYRGHSMSDPGTYRSREEVESWRRRDCIPKIMRAIQHDFGVTDEELKAVDDQVRETIRKAVEFAENGRELPVEQLCEDVYAD